MKMQELKSTQKKGYGLHEMVSQLVTTSTPAAGRNRSFIVNDIPEDMSIKANPAIISTVIGNLLNTVVSHAKDSKIRISAKTYSNVVLVHVKDSNSFNSYAVSCGLQQFQPLAEKMGGYLDITSQRHKETTIAFSFPNLEAA